MSLLLVPVDYAWRHAFTCLLDETDIIVSFDIGVYNCYYCVQVSKETEFRIRLQFKNIKVYDGDEVVPHT